MAASISGAVLCRVAVAVLIVSTLSSYADAGKYDCRSPCRDCPNCGNWCKHSGYPKGGQCMPKDASGIDFCCCDRTGTAVRKLIASADALP